MDADAALPVPVDAVRFAGAFAALRVDAPAFFGLVPEVRAGVPAAFFAVPADEPAAFFVLALLVLAVGLAAFFAPGFRAAEDAEVRFAPLPLRPPEVRLPPLCFRGCTSISKFASSRALRSPLMNPKHSMFPV